MLGAYLKNIWTKMSQLVRSITTGHTVPYNPHYNVEIFHKDHIFLVDETNNV